MLAASCPNEDCLRQAFSRIGTSPACCESPEGPNRLEALLAREWAYCGDLQAAQANVAASAALLPITPEMAWAIPQLLKRVALVAPGIVSTSGVLRSLVRKPEWDSPFAKAFEESGFLSCDTVLARVRWKYDIGEMMAKAQRESAWPVREHCRTLLSQHNLKQPFDWYVALSELQTLASWFPEMETLRLLRELYTRLYVLHMQSVQTVQCWLHWRAGPADGTPDSSQGVHHA